MPNTHLLRTWVEVSTANLERNYRLFRSLLNPGCRMMAVAKSNAYGHSLVDYSRAVQALGVDWIGVDSIVEAAKLRATGITVPLLVLGYTLPGWFGRAAKQNISVTISSRHALEQLHDTRDLKIHLKIDSGMHRQGFQPDEFADACRYIAEHLPHISIEGIYTHFAAAKDPRSPEATEQQIRAFERCVAAAAAHGMTPIRHACATAGTLIFPRAHYDMVRIGIGLMGLWPSLDTRRHSEAQLPLQPILSWKTLISEIKTIARGEGIGYDFTERVARDTTVAILPVGYWHGYRRCLSSIGHVLVRGRRAKVLGRVSMDMVTIDVTDIPGAAVGDTVTLLGQDGDEVVDVYEMARLSNGSWYETITQINPLIKKCYG